MLILFPIEQVPIVLSFTCTSAQTVDPIAGTVTIARFNGERDQVDVAPGSDLPPLQPGDEYFMFHFPTKVDWDDQFTVSIGK